MLEDYLFGIGFDDSEINTIQKMLPKTMVSESTLLYNIKNLYHYFKRNGIDNNSFKSIILITPNLLLESIENIKTKLDYFNELGFNRISFFSMLKNYPYILDVTSQSLNNKIDKFQDLGFTKEAIIKIFSNYPTLFRGDFSYYKKRFQLFLDFGYSKKDTLSILTCNPKLFDLSISNFNKHIDIFHDMGFKDSNIIKITTVLPELLLGSNVNIEDHLSVLLDFGYSGLDLVHIIQVVPMILKSYYLDSLNSKLELLLSFGFSKKEIIFMTCNNPYIFLYSNDSITEKFTGFGELSYRLEDVISFFNKVPILFGYRMETIKERVNFIKENNLESYLFDKPNILVFSVELLKARLLFLERRKIDLTKKINHIFLSEVEFEKKYHISREELWKGEYEWMS